MRGLIDAACTPVCIQKLQKAWILTQTLYSYMLFLLNGRKGRKIHFEVAQRRLSIKWLSIFLVFSLESSKGNWAICLSSGSNRSYIYISVDYVLQKAISQEESFQFNLQIIWIFFKDKAVKLSTIPKSDKAGDHVWACVCDIYLNSTTLEFRVPAIYSSWACYSPGGEHTNSYEAAVNGTLWTGFQEVV